MGGNLTLLANLVGTPYALDLDGAVLFLEEVGERPYAIDRYLTRMHVAGALRRVSAALLGSLTRCDEKSGPPHPDAGEVVDERLRAFAIPALFGAPIGHGDRNLALPFGGLCAVDLDGGSVELLEPATA